MMTDNYYKHLSNLLISAVLDLEQAPPPAFKQWQQLHRIITEHHNQVVLVNDLMNAYDNANDATTPDEKKNH